ncbi:MAG: thermonuclease family protein [Methanobacteriota archaeon]|nr:MAG: thermonuclease family protein [Euryarchaeota archaeon]
MDGDTLDVEPNLMIRLVLVNAPELNAAGGPEAKDYLVSLCLGTRALVDEDDNQIGRDPYGRVLAVVTCDGTNANADMISSGLAKTYYMFCSLNCPDIPYRRFRVLPPDPHHFDIDGDGVGCETG